MLLQSLKDNRSVIIGQLGYVSSVNACVPKNGSHSKKSWSNCLDNMQILNLK